MAWRPGDMNHFQRPPQSHHFRPSSPSVTSTSSDDREEVPMVRHPPRRPHSRQRHHNHHHHHHHGYHMPVPSMDHYPGMHPDGSFRNGTLRSTRSVPALALATWDGEPCPVHGQGHPHHHPPHQHGPPFHLSGGMPGTMRRYGSMFDVRATPVYPPPPSSVLDKKSIHGSMQMLPTGPPFGPPMGPPSYPPHFYPPHMMRMPPRQVVIPAGVETLPMRDPYKSRQPPPRLVAKMEEDPYSMDQVCCKGHLIVLWIILGVVTVGVILGIILGVTIA